MKITNDKGRIFGKYCGPWTGKVILATGNHIVLTFNTDSFGQERGFLIYFTAVPLGKDNKDVQNPLWKAFATIRIYIFLV